MNMQKEETTSEDKIANFLHLTVTSKYFCEEICFVQVVCSRERFKIN